VGVLRPLDALLEAYRTGGGVPYEAYGADTRDGIGAINRPQFVKEVAGWLGSIPEVDARLRADPPARVADVACGTGWSSIAIARAYPEVTVDAIDVDPESIEDARRNVAEAGLEDRVRPIVHDASAPDLGGRYDLALQLRLERPPLPRRGGGRHLPAWRGGRASAPRRLRGELLGATVFEVDPGWSGLYHLHHGNEELAVVLEGTPALRTPKGEVQLRPGQAALFRRGAEGAHGLRNDSNGPARFVAADCVNARRLRVIEALPG
jgi:quercetin dioxygenase-like cupin family protein